MRILYFGDFDPEYSRNKVIIQGLREHRFDVNVCPVRVKGFKSFKKYYCLWKEYWKHNAGCDVIIVGYSDSRWIAPFIKAISEKPIVWDGFFSIYDSWVFDRKLVRQRSLKANWYWFLDWINLKAADVILSDTNAYIEYLSETFHVPREKFIRVLVSTGQDSLELRENQESKNNFLVYFYGYFIPLQGVEYIIEAANLLRNESIDFQIIGDGQTHDKVFARAKALGLDKVSFIPRLSFSELMTHLRCADVCLGIFGDTPKAQRVIPNKAYDAIAAGKALISADTPAMRELFTDKKDILFCNVADAQDLAKKILDLKNDAALRTKIARGGHVLYEAKATSAKVTIPLAELLKTL